MIIGCCCNRFCQTVDQWLNITTVNKYGEGSPVAPFKREMVPCANPGDCGAWYTFDVADRGEMSAQAVTAGEDDIVACAGEDATHDTNDHNCYEKSTPVTICRGSHGGAWSYARKPWHGRFDLMTAADGDASGVPQQTKYREVRRSVNINITGSHHLENDSDSVNACLDPFVFENDWTDIDYQFNKQGIFTVGRYTGAVARTSFDYSATTTGSWSENGANKGAPYNELIAHSASGSDNFTHHGYLPFQPSSSMVFAGCSGGGYEDTTFTHPVFGVEEGGTDVDSIVAPHIEKVAKALLPYHKFTGLDSFGAGVVMDDMTAPPIDGETTAAGIESTVKADIASRIGALTYATPTITWLTDDVTYNATELSGHFVFTVAVTQDPDTYDWGGTMSITVDLSFNLSLHSPYTAENLMTDWRSLQAAWDLSDYAVHPLREDGELANAVMSIYDEREFPINPDAAVVFTTLNDYREEPINDHLGYLPWNTGDNPPPTGWTYNAAMGVGTFWTPTWVQMNWLDEADASWTMADGTYLALSGTVPDGFSASGDGAPTLVTGKLSGEIVAHNPAGYDRHFWFGFLPQTREYDFGDDLYSWDQDGYGGLSEAPIPEAALRWPNRNENQFDPDQVDQSEGWYPQGWVRMRDGAYTGILEGGKHIELMERWPRVNFQRPCGKDRFAVDQLTVCWIISGDPASGLVCKKTQNAIKPLETGGLAVGHFVMVGGDGIYKIAAITDEGDETSPGGVTYRKFTVEVGSLVCAIPAGADIAEGYFGKMRWWTYGVVSGIPTVPAPLTGVWAPPGICGRVAFSSQSYSDPTLTVTIGEAMPYFQTGELVDICDADMTVLASQQVATRIDDTHFSIESEAIAGAAWVVPSKHYDESHTTYSAKVAGTKYYWDVWGGTKRTLVNLAWTFDIRGIPGSSPGDWYNEQDGCVGITVTQGVIEQSPRPRFTGVVPTSTTTETFTNAVLYPTPVVSGWDADSKAGLHWQCTAETVMADPFWQKPFAPDGEVDLPDALYWTEDDGTGQADYDEANLGGGVDMHQFYAHKPWVEALAIYPNTGSVPGAGASNDETPPTLPADAPLPFDFALIGSEDIIVPPPYYRQGIPMADRATGDHATIETPWVFWLRAKANIETPGRFADDYAEFILT